MNLTYNIIMVNIIWNLCADGTQIKLHSLETIVVSWILY
jgi:hypothetical protein